jgi:hypothetical protein
MKIKDHDLRQLNEERLKTLQEKDPAALLQLANRLLHGKFVLPVKSVKPGKNSESF